jgi:hypothetical protein
MSRRTMLFAAFASLAFAIGCTQKPDLPGEAGVDGADARDTASVKGDAGAGAEGRADGGVPLVRYLPSETLAYVSLDDASRAKADFERTALKKMYADQAVQQFLEKPIGKFKELLEDAEQKTGLKFDDICSAFKGQMCCALTRLGPGEVDPEIALLVLADVTDAAAAGRLMDWVVGELEKDPPTDATVEKIERDGWRGVSIGDKNNASEPDATIALSDTLALIAVHTKGDPSVEAVLAGTPLEREHSLAGSEDFGHVLGKLDAKRAYTIYCAADRLMNAVLAIAREENPEETAMAVKVLAALGLDKIISVGAGLAITPPGLTSKLYVRVPPPRTGLFSIFPTTPLEEATKRAASTDAHSFAACRFDVKALMTVVKEIVAIAGQTQNMEQGLAGIGAMVGIDIEKDVIDSMGDQVIFAVYPAEPSTNPMATPYKGMALALELTDAPKMQGIMETLLGMADMMLKAQGTPGIQKEDHEGVAIKSSDVQGIIAPCIAVTDTHLVIAGGVPAAKTLIDNIAGRNAAPLIDTAEFKDLAAHVGGIDSSEIIYSDPRNSLPQGMMNIEPMLAMMPGDRARELEEWVDLEKLPPAEALAKYLFAQIDALHVDDEGLAFHGYGPFGGSGGPAVVGGVVGAAAAIIIPNVVSRRPEAPAIENNEMEDIF